MLKARARITFAFCAVIMLCSLTTVGATAAEANPAPDPIYIDSWEKLFEYWGADNNSVVLERNAVLSVNAFSPAYGYFPTSLDLNGHNLTLLFTDYYTDLCFGSIIQDSVGGGAIILSPENEAKKVDFGLQGSLLIENLSFLCEETDFTATLHATSALNIQNCQLTNIQIENFEGDVKIQDSRITVKGDNITALHSYVAVGAAGCMDLSGSSENNGKTNIYGMGGISWLDEVLSKTTIKNSNISVSGQSAEAIHFEGYSLTIENSSITATGENSVGISYGESLSWDQDVCLPVLENCYIAGERHAIKYNKLQINRENPPFVVTDQDGRWYWGYPYTYVDLPGYYLNTAGQDFQTTEDTKALYPINGEMVPGFVDVAPGDWYADAVMGLYQAHIMTGTSKASFGPNVQLSRGMVTTCIWRLENEPVVNDAIPFADVANGQYYTEAVRWAVSEGIVSGYDADHFGPNDAVTREQLAVMLYNYARYKGCDSAQAGMEIREFNDYESISGYASDATAWAVNARLMQGKNNSLMPKGNATRAQFAVMLHRFLATYDVFSDM